MTPFWSTYSHKEGPTSPDWSSVVARMSLSHSKRKVAISFSGLIYVRGSGYDIPSFGSSLRHENVGTGIGPCYCLCAGT
jgi:hypothetical protein